MTNVFRFLTFILLFSIFTSNLHGSQSNENLDLAAKTDRSGNPINAHGGGILSIDKVYYWYGEYKIGKTFKVINSNWENYRVNAGGVACYSSVDLKHWRFHGIVLKPNLKDTSSDLHFSKVIERPKVIYNKKTKKFVMWMHIDSQDYLYARSGVAVSDSPFGPFKYIGSLRPNGNMARDMTIFQDDDGSAYEFYSSEDNATLHICQLSDDYLSPTTNEIRILINQRREAPAVFKYHAKYYLITSGCSGWSPNAAMYATADRIMGDWKTHDNPCKGKDADKTFAAQSAFVLPVADKPDTFIFMADRWNKLDLEKSGYLWLPLKMINGIPVIKFD